MTTPVGESSLTLAAFLHARALASTRDRLAVDILCGAAVASVALWARPQGWVALASAGVAFAMYGAWAVAERQLQPSAEPRRQSVEFLWFAVRALAGTWGLLAFALCLFALLGMALGTWIS
ncbi:MAG: hypothetical protein FJ363_08495 [Gemmatimonadetes bacterium]|nr:hypothetical protein [Gemmatimonadota bacterium]